MMTITSRGQLVSDIKKGLIRKKISGLFTKIVGSRENHDGWYHLAIDLYEQATEQYQQAMKAALLPA